MKRTILNIFAVIVITCGLNAQTVDLTVAHTTEGSLGTEISDALTVAGKTASEIVDTLFINGTANLTLDDCLTVKTSLIAAKILDLTEAKFANDSIPAQLTASAGAFGSNTNLVTILFPPTLRVVGDKAIGGCANLVTADLPNNVVAIFKMGFLSCTKLIMSSLPENLKYLGDGAFNGCTKVSFSSLPNGLITLGDNLASAGQGVFRKCTSISITEIPTGVKVIGQDVFNECTQLTSMAFPAGLTTIGDRAFATCSALTNLYFKGNIPPVTTTASTKHSFRYLTLSTITCRVPIGYTSTYNAIAPWSSMSVVDFTTMIENTQRNELKAFVDNGKLIIQNIAVGEKYAVYSAVGQLEKSGISQANELTINLSTKGIHFIKTGNRSLKALY